MAALAYEHHVIEYHRTKKDRVQSVWHWSNVPHDALVDSGWWVDLETHRKRRLGPGEINCCSEYGLDGLALNKDGSYTGIQAKNWKKCALTPTKLGTFISAINNRMVPKDSRNDGILYYANGKANALSPELRKDLYSSKTISAEHVPSCKLAPVTIPSDKDETLFELHPYQIDAVANLNDSCWTRGLLTMPPGTGKTLVVSHHVAHVMQQYALVVMLAPTRVLVEQLKSRVVPFLSNTTHGVSWSVKKVDSDNDGTRNLHDIKSLFDNAKTSNPAIIFATYKSGVDVVLEAILGTDEDVRAQSLLVVDEAHNTLGPEYKESIHEGLGRAMGRTLLVTEIHPACFL